ncbi:unnamed protein product [Durusdinium trenchii]|uniref:beta-N-acetylhexosaminidase n=2 Tax=Durusdinium trenchii TaxID=1381693 RepID=A0ABP0IH37_9DINO
MAACEEGPVELQSPFLEMPELPELFAALGEGMGGPPPGIPAALWGSMCKKRLQDMHESNHLTVSEREEHLTKRQFHVPGRGKRTLTLQEDPTGKFGGSCGSGTVLWPAAMALVEHLDGEVEKSCLNCRVLELGAGVGAVGLFLALFKGCEVWLTEAPEQLPLLVRNVNENSPDGLDLQVAPLKWGDKEALEQLAALGRFDMIVGSDVTYRPECLSDLLSTAHQLMSPQGRFFLSLQDRPGEAEHLEAALKTSSLQIRGEALRRKAKLQGAEEVSVLIFELCHVGAEPRVVRQCFALSFRSWWPPVQLPSGPSRACSGFQAVTSTPELQDAFQRYKSIFFPHASTPAKTAVDCGLVVDILDTTSALQLGVDESYTLDVDLDGITVIAAKTVWGALHGLETMSQLIEFNFKTGQYSVSGIPVHIEDKPRFQHRGLLIDSGRHFEPMVHVKAMIDSMTYAKLNVLHWHLTEDESFPIASRVFPELPEKGAFNDFEQYTWEDIVDVVEYARRRGIRVIPEFDMPGHSSSWRKSHPEVFAEGCLSESSRGAFDPAKNATFELLEAALQDWSKMFVDGFLHLGSDEVPANCWNNSKDIAWMKTMGFSNSSEVFNYFVNKMVNISKKLGRETILWDEAFLSAKPPQEAVIQNWHDASLLQKIVDAGYRAVFSSNGGYTNGWYLDGLKATWQNMYVLEPLNNISAEKAHLVLGGEGCMWGEHVDPSDFEFTVWPRLAAIAERLWSDREVNSTAEAQPRLETFRCRLLSRGVHTGIVGGSGRGTPPGPGSCTQQGTSEEQIFV